MSLAVPTYNYRYYSEKCLAWDPRASFVDASAGVADLVNRGVLHYVVQHLHRASTASTELIGCHVWTE